ncbi:MAG: serine/threonine protein kinase, partial [Myxococcales bacterium]|nr:serine/threonine protein kinase [Myxococcales bacterium]
MSETDPSGRDWLATGAPVAAARRRVLEGLFGPDPSEARAGRFELRTPLGRGSFGTVWRAFDPLLQREVAVKLVDGPRHRPGHAATQRFLREARAVASLSHEHVVQVFDVGIIDGSPYLAMELVEGGSLDQWLREPRPWPAIRRVFLGAARGLAAAHAAGIVHRDLKPANVLLGEDERPRVADFGLAVLGEEGRTESGSSSGAQTTASTPFAGTPAFMAPEQHLGGPVDPRADVYAWCVSLHLALHGELPFRGATAEALLHAKLHRRITYGPRGAGAAPRWLRTLVRRGLAPDPEQRWPSMDALIAALERGGRPAVPRWVVAGLGAGVLALGWIEAGAEATDCSALAHRSLDPRWNPTARQQIEDRLADRPGLGPDVVARLDAYAQGWLTARVDACATGVDAPRLEPRLACLDDRLAELQASIDDLREADDVTRDHARQLVRELEDPERCTSASTSARHATATDPQRAAELEAVRHGLAALEVARRAGRLGSEPERAA